MIRQLKAKNCRHCKAEYRPMSSLTQACSITCALALVEEKKEKNHKAEIKQRQKKERISLKARKLAVKPRSKWLSEAQIEFNRYIRARDIKAGEPCISCQRHHTGKWNAGHYIAVGMGGGSPLRFTEDNVHLQCEPCNSFLSGNIALYRVNLVKKIGTARVEKLEGPHNALKLDIEQIKELKAEYKAKTKLLINGQPQGT